MRRAHAPNAIEWQFYKKNPPPSPTKRVFCRKKGKIITCRLNLPWRPSGLSQRFPTTGTRPGTRSWRGSKWDQKSCQIGIFITVFMSHGTKNVHKTWPWDLRPTNLGTTGLIHHFSNLSTDIHLGPRFESPLGIKCSKQTSTPEEKLKFWKLQMKLVLGWPPWPQRHKEILLTRIGGQDPDLRIA